MIESVARIISEFPEGEDWSKVNAETRAKYVRLARDAILTVMLTKRDRLDLRPLIDHFEKELQRLRDQLFVEQSAARSAREALAASEARLKAAEGERERIRGDAYDERRGWQNRALNAENDLDAARDERDSAVAELERIKATMGSASTVPPALVAGSTAAVIEAYRLLRGHEPHYDGKREWVDSADAYKSSGNNHLDEAGCFLLYWLDENAPGGRP